MKPEDYERYGPEWENELILWSKKSLISFIRGILIAGKRESELIEKAFLAGRSQTSWEQFKIDNKIE